MSRDIPIYPEVKIECKKITTGFKYTDLKKLPRITEHRAYYKVRLQTKLRLKGEDDKWYYNYHYGEFDAFDKTKIAEYSKSFYMDIYNFLFLGKIDLSIEDSFKEKMFELCEDQSEESERLTKINKVYEG
jgi:hypothetical protein